MKLLQKILGKLKYIILVLGIIMICIASFQNRTVSQEDTSFSVSEWIGQEMGKRICNTYLPIFSFIEEKDNAPSGLQRYLWKQFPILKYMDEGADVALAIEDEQTIEMLLQNEARDENEVDENGNVILSEGDVGLENTMPNVQEDQAEISLEDKMKLENQTTEFIKNEAKVIPYDMNQFADFDSLYKEFYVLDKSTTIDSSQLNVEALSKDMKLDPNKKSKILIYHTHSQEAFVDSIPGDETTSILGAGEKLANILRDEYGYDVIHHTGKYDVESRDDAYAKAAPGLEKVLAENPDIDVVIDLHRDGVNGDVRLVQDVNGRPTAQFMFFNGLSRTKHTGDISYLANPYIADNLAFSFQMQVKCNEYYPGLARKIYLKGYRYNMQYCPKSLLIELGCQNNTVQEIMNAIDPIAQVLDMVLSGEEP